MKRRSKLRRVGRSAVAGIALYVIIVTAGCMNPSTPFDAALNALPAPGFDPAAQPGLQAVGSRPTLVVLQHGICRSAWSLWRMERSLEAHGYEVFNPSYPSTQLTIEDCAALLARRLEAHLATRPGPAPNLAFVGHSMGGLVIRSYLSRSDARPATSCVFIATPHAGASLAAKRKNLWLFRLFLGSKAGPQLELDHPFYATLRPLPDSVQVGCLYGGNGDEEGRNDDVPGDDDGTVGTLEAQCPEQDDALMLPLGHTMISFSSDAIAQVLHFLRYGAFSRPAQ